MKVGYQKLELCKFSNKNTPLPSRVIKMWGESIFLTKLIVHALSTL